MKIKITPESPGHTSMEVEDNEIIEAYEKGGMEAVEHYLCEQADAMPETPFWWPETPDEDVIKDLVKRKR